MFDWNDLRFFLTVARAGNTLAASRELRVSQTTVARRIQALEATLGLELFDKRRTGYVPTEAAQGLLAGAREAEAALAGFAALVEEQKRGLTGTVRFATNELFANQLLGPALKRFRTAYPGLRLEIITGDRHLDLARGEADVALRGTAPPTDAGLVGRRLAVDRWSVYCSRDYADANGIPRSVEELAGHTFIGVETGRYKAPIAEWLGAAVPESAIILRRSSAGGLFADVRNGLGVSVISDVVAATEPDLVHCFTPDIDNSREIWLLTHERLRHVPRVRAVLDFLGSYFASHPSFKGR